MAAFWIVLTVVLGFAFYVVRCRWRLWYGIAELVVASIVIFLTFHPLTHYLAYDATSLLESLVIKGAGALAGIYVMVRGLDNIAEGLPPVWRSKWEHRFKGSASTEGARPVAAQGKADHPMVKVTVVVREPGSLKIEFFLDFELPEVPRIGEYISIRRLDRRTASEDVVVRRVWWQLFHRETHGHQSTETRGELVEVFVECDPAIGPYSSEDWRRRWEASGVEMFDVSRRVI
jgi:hypothetical protein